MPLRDCYSLIMGRKEKGQVLLVVVLITIVALTVGLSLASKSIINVRTSTEEVSAKKSLSAAEAGIEQALQNQVSIANRTFPNDNTTSFTTDVKEVKGSEFLLNGGNVILQDEGVDLWLSKYSDDRIQRYADNSRWSGNLTIYWGETLVACGSSALEIQFILGSKTSPAIKRYAFDPCQSRQTVNNFTLASQLQHSISNRTFYYSASVSILPSLPGIIARIVPLYANAVIGVSGDNPLPSQGFVYDSTGKSGTTERKINFFKGYEQLNNQNFSYGLFAP